MQKIFAAGTGTDVGKTLISALLVSYLKADYWKPIQSGSMYQNDNEVIASLTDNTTIHPNSYCFKEPLSPHIAAKRENSNIVMDRIKVPLVKNKLIIEGAGGILVPLNTKNMLVDLIKQINAPVILVAPNILGTINHACLSLEVLRYYDIPVIGVILNGTNTEFDNHNAIEHYGKTKILATIDLLSPLNKTNLELYLQQIKINL